MTRYADLIAKLEAAPEGSRFLDDAIAEAINLELPSDPCQWPPHFTTSLDAARSLSDWVLIIASDIHADGLAYVELGDPSRSPSVEVHGIHSNLILAWCIAALKARAAGEGEDG